MIQERGVYLGHPDLAKIISVNDSDKGIVVNGSMLSLAEYSGIADHFADKYAGMELRFEGDEPVYVSYSGGGKSFTDLLKEIQYWIDQTVLSREYLDDLSFVEDAQLRGTVARQLAHVQLTNQEHKEKLHEEKTLELLKSFENPFIGGYFLQQSFLDIDKFEMLWNDRVVGAINKIHDKQTHSTWCILIGKLTMEWGQVHKNFPLYIDPLTDDRSVKVINSLYGLGDWTYINFVADHPDVSLDSFCNEQAINAMNVFCKMAKNYHLGVYMRLLHDYPWHNQLLTEPKVVGELLPGKGHEILDSTRGEMTFTPFYQIEFLLNAGYEQTTPDRFIADFKRIPFKPSQKPIPYFSPFE